MRTLSNVFTGDKDVVMTAVSKSGKTLEWASNEMKNDQKVVLAAVKENGTTLFFAFLAFIFLAFLAG